MKARLRIFIFLGTIFSTLLAPSGAFARPALQQSITILSYTFTGPDAQGAYDVEGTYQASGYFDTADTSIRIYVEFIDDNGTWPGVYDSYSLADKCNTLNGACVDRAYVNGDTLGGTTIHEVPLLSTEDGATLPFAGTFTPPPGATQMRLIGFYSQVINGNPWPAFIYRFDMKDPLPVLPPNLSGQNQTAPTPTPTSPPQTGPCTIIISPTSATVSAGAAVSFAGAALWSDGSPVSNALLNIDCDSLDGSGCVSPARTDAAGNFSFTYAAPPNTTQSSSAVLQVSVEGCPVVTSVPVTIQGGTASQGPIPGVCPSPAISAALVLGMFILQTRPAIRRKKEDA